MTIRSDSSKTATGRGRDSVRLTSTKSYTHGLVVLDLEHMPASACGIWPAFWMTGPSWPNSGEIDIIEGVSYQSQNAMTMHTSGGCSLISKDCQGNQGCGMQSGGSASYGDGFNNGNGGVYAMEWTSSAINIYFFGRSSIPAGILGGSPDPSTWGTPMATFQGGSGCTIDDHFKDNNIIFDTTFCGKPALSPFSLSTPLALPPPITNTILPTGDWAGSVWSQDPSCSSKAATCTDYVRDNPSAFANAYWTINSLKVYSSSGSAPPAVAATINTPVLAAHVSVPEVAPSIQAPAPIAPVSAPEVPPSSKASTTPASTAPLPNPSAPVGLGSTTPGGAIAENPVTARAVPERAEETVLEHPLAAKMAPVKRSARLTRHLKAHQLRALGHS